MPSGCVPPAERSDFHYGCNLPDPCGSATGGTSDVKFSVPDKVLSQKRTKTAMNKSDLALLFPPRVKILKGEGC